jgi:pyridoxal phosphate enzyme (YggS family)
MKPAETVCVADNLERVQARIQAAQRRAGRTDEVTLVVVTKTVPAERIAEAYRLGVRHFGENRVQEFEAKRPQLMLPAVVWHLVGHLQSNKARRVTELFSCLDSLDSLHLAKKVSAAAAAAGRRLPVLIQVDLGQEATKFGVSLAGLPALVEQVAALDGLSLRGLMTIPPYLPPEQVRPFFRRLRELGEEQARRQIRGAEMAELSMGMSHDFEVAIEEGATQVRLGTALFGERPQR